MVEWDDVGFEFMLTDPTPERCEAWCRRYPQFQNRLRDLTRIHLEQQELAKLPPTTMDAGIDELRSKLNLAYALSLFMARAAGAPPPDRETMMRVLH